jgi:hypothetical protein
MNTKAYWHEDVQTHLFDEGADYQPMDHRDPASGLVKLEWRENFKYLRLKRLCCGQAERRMNAARIPMPSPQNSLAYLP